MVRTGREISSGRTLGPWMCEGRILGKRREGGCLPKHTDGQKSIAVVGVSLCSRWSGKCYVVGLWPLRNETT